MEAATEHLIPESNLTLPEAMQAFFAQFSAEETYTIVLFHLFKAWACQPENKKHCEEKELALFCDQLIRFVAAAEQLHQANRPVITAGEMSRHD